MREKKIHVWIKVLKESVAFTEKGKKAVDSAKRMMQEEKQE